MSKPNQSGKSTNVAKLVKKDPSYIVEITDEMPINVDLTQSIQKHLTTSRTHLMTTRSQSKKLTNQFANNNDYSIRGSGSGSGSSSDVPMIDMENINLPTRLTSNSNSNSTSRLNNTTIDISASDPLPMSQYCFFNDRLKGESLLYYGSNLNSSDSYLPSQYCFFNDMTKHTSSFYC